MKHLIKLTFKPQYLVLMTLLLFSLGLSRQAQAHWADMAALELDMGSQQAQASLTLPTPFFNTADSNHDGQLSPAEIKQGLPAIQQLLNQHIELNVNASPATMTVTAATGPAGSPLASQPGMTRLALNWSWIGTANQLALRYDLFPEDAPNAHCLASVQQGPELMTLVFDREHPRHALTQPSFVEQVQQFSLLGIEHIATGYDHLLFLLALLLASSRLMYLLKIVSAFTLAHSVTLTLAVLGLVSAPGRWVESLIAASIIYVVAVEVLWKRQETPWYVVAGFGLIHGLGFASILRELELPTNQLVTALVSFNLGIELGQLAIVLVMWGALFMLSKKEQWYRPVQTVCASLILLMAGYWFIERAILGG